MFAVIFEVQPRPERWNDYLGIAQRLRPELEQIDGFIDNERFASQSRQGWILSLSTWRDEKAVIRWRTLAPHHFAQAKGRTEIMEDYHLRVGELIADSEVPLGQQLARQRLDETEIGVAKAITISERAPTDATASPGSDMAADLALPRRGTAGVVEYEVFGSITEPGKQLLLVSWRNAAAAAQWPPRSSSGSGLRHRSVRVIRDYGLRDRREAPQYYPAVGANDVRR
ncbi:MAG: antibiotic biosynthesis monooxygenase family protein [Stellaceae bacterium]